MTFDPELAAAELDRLLVIVAHNLRQIRLAGDKATARVFNQKLGKAADTARRVAKELRDKGIK